MKEGGCSNIASYHWSVYYNITDIRGLNPSSSILTTMTHHDRSVCKQVIALVEEGGLSASAVGGWYGVPGSKSIAIEIPYGMDKLEGAIELGYGAYPVQLRMLC
jgi:hypothetical protein